MNIETKFNVGDIVKHKYESNPERVMGFEVMEIKSNTCYAGTQNFYYCRALFADKVFKNRFDENSEFQWAVSYSVSNDPHMPTAWQQMREDELIFVTDEERIILTNCSANQTNQG